MHLKELDKVKKAILNHKFLILGAITALLIVFCLWQLYMNVKNYSNDNKELFEGLNVLYTTLIIGLITIENILINLRDNEILKNQYKSERKQKEDKIVLRKNNIKLLIKTEVFNNLDLLREYKSSIPFGKLVIIKKPHCTTIAWKSTYNELPSIFKENELAILIDFYNDLEKLLDDDNWLKPPSESDTSSNIVETDEMINFENLQRNKIEISNIIHEILKYENEMDFLESIG